MEKAIMRRNFFSLSIGAALAFSATVTATADPLAVIVRRGGFPGGGAAGLHVFFPVFPPGRSGARMAGAPVVSDPSVRQGNAMMMFGQGNSGFFGQE